MLLSARYRDDPTINRDPDKRSHEIVPRQVRTGSYPSTEPIRPGRQLSRRFMMLVFIPNPDSRPQLAVFLCNQRFFPSSSSKSSYLFVGSLHNYAVTPLLLCLIKQNVRPMEQFYGIMNLGSFDGDAPTTDGDDIFNL